MTPCALMKHKMRQLLEEQTDFAFLIFSVLYNSFSGLMFFLACDKMSQEKFAAIGERFVDVKESTRGTRFSVGRLAAFQVQREQWVSSSQRAVVEG